MPYKDPDHEDPLEMAAAVVPGDTDKEMAACVIEEYLMMRYTPEQILRFFASPLYVGTHRVYRRFGEIAIKEMIAHAAR